MLVDVSQWEEVNRWSLKWMVSAHVDTSTTGMLVIQCRPLTGEAWNPVLEGGWVSAHVDTSTTGMLVI
jgi:hypothetical protein